MFNLKYHLSDNKYHCYVSLSSLDLLKFYATSQNYQALEISNFNLKKGHPILREDIYWFDIQYRSDDKHRNKQLVLRCSSHPDNNFEKESLVTRHVRKFKFPTPEVLEVGVDKDNLGGAFIITSRLGDQVLGDKIDEFIYRQEKPEKNKIINQYYQLLEFLQMMPLPSEDVLNNSVPSEKYQEHLTSSLKRMFSDLPDTYEEEYSTLKSWLEQNITKIEGLDPVLIHGDLHLYNLRLFDGELGVVNWNNTRFDDPRTEISKAIAHNLLLLDKDIANYICDGLLELSDYDITTMNTLIVYYGLHIINSLLSILRDERQTTKFNSEKIFSLYRFEHLESFISTVTGLPSPSFRDLLEKYQ